MENKRAIWVMAIAFLAAVCLIVHYGRSGSKIHASTVPAVPPAVTPAPIQKVEAYSAWSVSRDVDPVTGVITVTAVDALNDDVQLVVRQTGKKLECYITTGQFLETSDNIDNRDSIVRYKIGDGAMVRQTWTLSDDNEGLFYPGNPRAFLNRLRNAKTLAFEFKPSDYMPVPVTFDVTGFPDAIDLNES